MDKIFYASYKNDDCYGYSFCTIKNKKNNTLSREEIKDWIKKIEKEKNIEHVSITFFAKISE